MEIGRAAFSAPRVLARQLSVVVSHTKPPPFRPRGSQHGATSSSPSPPSPRPMGKLKQKQPARSDSSDADAAQPAAATFAAKWPTRARSQPTPLYNYGAHGSADSNPLLGTRSIRPPFAFGPANRSLCPRHSLDRTPVRYLYLQRQKWSPGPQSRRRRRRPCARRSLIARQHHVRHHGGPSRSTPPSRSSCGPRRPIGGARSSPSRCRCRAPSSRRSSRR